jgi:O-antigen/teichoic acid export membrane protein
MNKFIKDVGSIVSSKVFSILFQLGKVIIISRMLGPEKSGLIAALTVYPNIFMTIGSLGIRQATTYYVGKAIYPVDKVKIAVVQIWLLTTLLCLISCYFLIASFSNSGNNLLLVLLAILPIPATLFNTYNSGIFLGTNDIRTFSKIDWLPHLFTLLGTIAFLCIFQWGISGALAATILGPIVMSIILLKRNRFIDSFSLQRDPAILKSLLSMGAVFAVSNLIINLNYKLDQIMMDKLSNPYELGIYSRGVSLVEYLWQIPMLFNSIIFAGSANAKNDKAFSIKVVQLLRLSLLVVAVIAIILALFSKTIVTLLFGESFIDCAQVIQILVPGVIMLTIFKVLWVDLAGRGNTKDAMKAMIPSLIVNITLNAIFLPRYGAYAAACASSSSYVIASVIFLIIYSRRTGLSLKEILFFSKKDFTPLVTILNKLPGTKKLLLKPK